MNITTTTTTTIETAIDKGLKTGYEKILDLILGAVGVPSFLKGPLKKFVSVVIISGVKAASDQLLIKMGEIPQATPGVCSQIAKNLQVLLKPSGFKCEVHGLTVLLEISGKTKTALQQLIQILKGGKSD